LFCLSTSALAQNTKENEDRQTIQALLTEVRLLRRTLQQTGLNAYRSQLIVEGMRARNEKVERLTRLLDDVRQEIENIGTTIPRISERCKVTEAMIENETDPNRRIQLEFETKELRQSIEQYKVRQERQREREQQLATQLRAEQTKLSELEGRLDALEREIENEVMRVQMDDGSNDGKKRPN
jgi:predicted  nucleic acid-binding Zn-ribbon protein